MRETVFKTLAVLVAIGAIGLIVWYGLQDPRNTRDPEAVTKNLTESMDLLKEALTLIEEKGKFGAGADRLKEGVFQFSKSISDLGKLRPAAKRKAVELVQDDLGELDGQFARILWTPEVGGAIQETMWRIYKVVGGVEVPPPPLSQLSGEMVGAIDSLTGALEKVKDAASAEAALQVVKEADDKLDAAKEAKDRLSAEDRETLQALSKPALEKLKALVAKTLAQPGVADKLKEPVDAVMEELNGLVS